jgi:hypothetical protein
MATIISTLTTAISYLNTLYNGSSTPPASGEEDYLVWTGLLNIGVSLWESEEGMLWKELYIELANSVDGDKTTDGTNSYALPALFKFPNSAYVWIGSGTSKQPYKVIKVQDKQLYENNSDRWCYFTGTTLEFNPNLTMNTGSTISYSYYKKASALSAGTDTFEMSDPMFAVYYALSELKKEEGDTSALTIASQKMEGMRTINFQVSNFQEDTTLNPMRDGFGT